MPSATTPGSSDDKHDEVESVSAITKQPQQSPPSSPPLTPPISEPEPIPAPVVQIKGKSCHLPVITESCLVKIISY